MIFLKVGAKKVAEEINNTQNLPIKISVIMPVYNGEKLISDTINSVIHQKLTELEIIIINDGSTDKTEQILTEYEKTDSRITVKTLKNGGPAKARNVGIGIASGEYIYFIDADDLIEENMLLEMYNLAKTNDLDVCACGYVMENVETKNNFSQDFLFKDFVAKTRTEFRENLMPLIKSHLMYVVWNKLFKTKMIKSNSILFADFLSGEDRLFNVHTFPCIKTFGFVNKPFYHYFLRGQSTLANKYVQNRFDAALRCHMELIRAYQLMGIYSKQNKNYLDFVFVKGIMACFTQLNSKGCPLSFKQKRSYIGAILQMRWVKEAIVSVDDEVFYSKIVNRILRLGNKTLIYLMAKAIYFLQYKFNKFYLALKHNKHSNPKK